MSNKVLVQEQEYMKKLSENLQTKVDKLETTFGRASRQSSRGATQDSKSILPLTMKHQHSHETVATAQLPAPEIDQVKQLITENSNEIKAINGLISSMREQIEKLQNHQIQVDDDSSANTFDRDT